MIFGKYINKYYIKYAPSLLFGLLALITVDYLQLRIPELYRLVVNGIIRRGEQKKAIPSSSIVPMDDVGESIEDSAKTPEELLMCREQLNQLLSRLQGILSKSEYDVLMLYGNGLSYKEIAERLSVTEKTVDNALQRARKKVRVGLQK